MAKGKSVTNLVLGVPEVSELYGLNRRTIYKLSRTALAPAVLRWDRTLRFSRVILEQLVGAAPNGRDPEKR